MSEENKKLVNGSDGIDVWCKLYGHGKLISVREYKDVPYAFDVCFDGSFYVVYDSDGKICKVDDLSIVQPAHRSLYFDESFTATKQIIPFKPTLNEGDVILAVSINNLAEDEDKIFDADWHPVVRVQKETEDAVYGDVHYIEMTAGKTFNKSDFMFFKLEKIIF